MFRSCLVLLSLACLPLSAMAQSGSPHPTRLQWNLEPKQQFYFEVKTLNDQQLWLVQPQLAATPQSTAQLVGTLMASTTQSPLHALPVRWLGYRLVEARQKIEHATILQFDVIEKTEKGYVLEERILNIKSNRVEAKPNNPLASRLKDKVLKVTLDPQLQVVKVEGYDALINSLTENSSEKDKEGSRYRALLSEQAVKQSLNEIFGSLPTKPLQRRDTWKETQTETLPMLGTVTRHLSFDFAGVEDGMARVLFQTKLAFEPGKDAEGSAHTLPFKVGSLDLSGSWGNGALLFDVSKGRLARKENSTILRGQMTLSFRDSVDKSDVVTYLRQQITMVVRLLDEPPAQQQPH